MSENCYHCGDDIIGKGFSITEKKFCCKGCKMVYQLLSDNNMDAFYTKNQESQGDHAMINPIRGITFSCLLHLLLLLHDLPENVSIEL